LAEWRFGALRGADPALYINLGTGVSAALVIGGRVLAGVHTAAGEIGYGWTSPMSVTGGVTPTLEERVGGRAIGRSASELLRSPVSAAQAFASKDARVRWLVRGALNGLALALGDLVLAVDPERVAIGGGLMNSQGDVLDAVNAHLKHLPFRPAVVPATFLTTASLQGAVALAIDATRSGPSETTLRWTRRG
jgi:glucokinase